MVQISRGLLENATTIAKTTQTVMDTEIRCGGFDTITLFVEYTNGNETGLIIQAHFKHASAGTAFQDASWSAAAGTKLATVNEFKMTASVDRFMVFDIRGMEFVEFTQGGSDDDGTPTGTITANYSMTSI